MKKPHGDNGPSKLSIGGDRCTNSPESSSTRDSTSSPPSSPSSRTTTGTGQRRVPAGPLTTCSVTSRPRSCPRSASCRASSPPGLTWPVPVILSKVTRPGSGVASSRRHLAIPVIDLYVHAWDLGAAVSIAVEIPADVIEYAHGYIDPLPDGMVRGDNRAFAPQTPVPAGATPTERFIAWTGRRPRP